MKFSSSILLFLISGTLKLKDGFLVIIKVLQK